jgi:hypothetical protein
MCTACRMSFSIPSTLILARTFGVAGGSLKTMLEVSSGRCVLACINRCIPAPAALSSDFVVAACLYHPANLPGRVHCVPQLVSAVAHAHKHGVVLRHIRLEKIHLTDETQTQLVFADLQVSWPPSIPASCLHCFVVAVLTPQCDCVAGSYRGTSQQRSSLRAQECV